MRRLRLGTRSSRLALIQSGLVAGRLRQEGIEVELVTIVTEGDLRQQDSPIKDGVFVKDLEHALVAGEIDLAVHSAKDLPLDPDPQLPIAAYPERADPLDALVTRSGECSVTEAVEFSQHRHSTTNMTRCYEEELLRITPQNDKPVKLQMRMPKSPPADGVAWKIVVNSRQKNGAVVEYPFPLRVREH